MIAGRHNKYIYQDLHGAPYPGKPTIKAILVEQSRFTVDENRRLRAERGVGPVSKIDPAVRVNFVPTKRAK